MPAAPRFDEMLMTPKVNILISFRSIASTAFMIIFH